MILIADILLAVAALGAAAYCRVLAQRLKRLANTDDGLGGAISTLTVRLDEIKSTLDAVSGTADRQTENLTRLTTKAESAARKIEILLAGLHEAQDCELDGNNPTPVLKLSTDERIEPSALWQRAGDREISRIITRKAGSSRSRATM